MPPLFFLIFGLVGVIGGLLAIVFNQQFATFLDTRVRGKVGLWDSVLATKPYQRTPSGRVPMLLFIAIGWVVVGVFFLSIWWTGA